MAANNSHHDQIRKMKVICESNSMKAWEINWRSGIFRPTACLDWVNTKEKKKAVVKLAVNQRALNAPLKGFEGQYKPSG